MEYPNLIQVSKEAQEFLEDSLDKSETLRMFPHERFIEFQAAVLGSTGIDLQGEAQELNSLRRIAEKLKTEPFWITVNHDPWIHPMGRVLAAKIFRSEMQSVWFLAALIGKYDASTLPSLTAALTNQPSSATFNKAHEGEAHVCFNSFEFPEEGIQEVLSDAPECVSSKIYDERRKSALILIELLSIIVPGAWLDGFNHKVGEASGEKFVQMIGWLSRKAIKNIRNYRQNAKILIESYIGNCKVQFLIDSGSEEIQIEAAESIPEHIDAAHTTVGQLLTLEPERLAFEYDRVRKKWVPLYAVTKRSGVITDRPYLTVIHSQGLSLASRASNPRELAKISLDLERNEQAAFPPDV